MADANLLSFVKPDSVAEQGKYEETKPLQKKSIKARGDSNDTNNTRKSSAMKDQRRPETKIQYDSNGIRIETEEEIRNWRKI